MSQIAYTPTPDNKVTETIHRTPIEGLFYLPFTPFEDNRGSYSELARLPELDDVLDTKFEVKQINLSRSKQNVARGFHAEKWRKLLTVLTGQAFCVFADLRPDSPTFKTVISVVMGNGDLHGSFFLPEGIGNSFCVIKGEVSYLYAVDQLYKNRDTSGDVAINMFDPDLDIQWPVERDEMIISERDKNSITLKEKFNL